MASVDEDDDLDTLRNLVFASIKKKSSSEKEDEDDDAELRALREAALKTKKSTAAAPFAPVPPEEMPKPVEVISNIHAEARLLPITLEGPALTRGPFLPRRGQYGRGHRGHPSRFAPGGVRGGSNGRLNNSAWTGSSPRGANLIIIQPLPMEGEEPPRASGQGKANGPGPAAGLGPGQGPSGAKQLLLRPQDKWLASSSDSVSAEPPKSRDKFSRYNRSDSEESEDSESEGEPSQPELLHTFDSSSEEDLHGEAPLDPLPSDDLNIPNMDSSEKLPSPQPCGKNSNSGGSSSSTTRSSSGSGSSSSSSSSGGDAADNMSDLSDAEADGTSGKQAEESCAPSLPSSSPQIVTPASSNASNGEKLSPHKLSACVVDKQCKTLPRRTPDAVCSPVKEGEKGRSDNGISGDRTRETVGADPHEVEKLEARRRKFENCGELDISSSSTTKIVLKGTVPASSKPRSESKQAAETQSSQSHLRSKSRSPKPTARTASSPSGDGPPTRHERHRSPLHFRDGNPQNNHRDSPQKEGRHRSRSDRTRVAGRLRQEPDTRAARSSDQGLSRQDRKRSDVTEPKVRDALRSNKNQNAHHSDSTSGDDDSGRSWKNEENLARKSSLRPGLVPLQSKMNSSLPSNSRRRSPNHSWSQRHQLHGRLSEPLGSGRDKGRAWPPPPESGFRRQRHHADDPICDSDSDSDDDSNNKPVFSSVVCPVTDDAGKRLGSPAALNVRRVSKRRKPQDRGDSSLVRGKRFVVATEVSEVNKRRVLSDHEPPSLRNSLSDSDGSTASSVKSGKRVWVEDDSDSSISVPRSSVHERLGKKVRRTDLASSPAGIQRESRRSVVVPEDGQVGKPVDKALPKRVVDSGVAVKENDGGRDKELSSSRAPGNLFKRASASLLAGENAAQDKKRSLTQEEILDEKMRIIREKNEAIVKRAKEVEEDKKRHGGFS